MSIGRKNELLAFFEDAEKKLMFGKNIRDHFGTNEINDQNVGYCSRIFYGLSKREFARTEPMLDCVNDAFKYDKLDTWLDLVIAYGITDLFTADGHLQGGIISLLNKLNRRIPENPTDELLDQIKSQLLAGYINAFFADPAYQIISKAMPEKAHLFSRSVNDRLTGITKIDKAFIERHDWHLFNVYKDKSFPVKLLREAIKKSEIKNIIEYKQLKNERSKYLEYLTDVPNGPPKTFATRVVAEIDAYLTETNSETPLPFSLLKAILVNTKQVLKEPTEENVNALNQLITEISVTALGVKLKNAINSVREYTQFIEKPLGLMTNVLIVKPLQFLDFTGYGQMAVEKAAEVTGGAMHAIVKYGFGIFQKQHETATPIQENLSKLIETNKKGAQ